MPVPDFESLYQTSLRARLEALDQARSHLVGQALKCGGIGLAAGALAWMVAGGFALGFEVQAMAAVIVTALGAGLGGMAWFLPGWTEYVSRFKAEVIAEIVKALGEGLSYEPGRGLSQADYARSGIFRERVDRYASEDYVAGSVGATAVRFSEVHSEYKTETRDSKGNRRTQWHTIFRGLLFEGDFHKDFHGRTLVLTDVAEKTFGVLGQAFQDMWSPDQLVKLEDPDFEREFVVHSTDQVEARYILSPALLTRILDFKRKARKDVQLSFVGSRVFAAIPYNDNLFEPSFFTSCANPRRIGVYYEALALVLSIVEDLNLNTRVWTKA